MPSIKSSEDAHCKKPEQQQQQAAASSRSSRGLCWDVPFTGERELHPFMVGVRESSPALDGLSQRDELPGALAWLHLSE